MAISESDYLHIHNGESTYLLLRSPSHFHLIRVDANLTEAMMKKLLQLYPCDTKQLRELGVHFSAFKADNLRSVVIKGYESGNKLELWLDEDTHEYQLGTDYSDDVLSSFFYGYPIMKHMPPKWEGLDPNIIRKTTWTVNATSIACAFIFYFVCIPYKLWSSLCILVQLVVLAITMLYADSFTLTEENKEERPDHKYHKGCLLPALIAPGFALCLRTLTDFTYDDSSFWLLLGISCIVFLILFIPIIWIIRKTHKRIISLIGIVIIMLFLGIGTIGQLNYLLDFNRIDSHIAETVDKRISRGTRSISYYCTVQLPNGELMELSLSKRIYGDINVGDDVIVTHHEGAFGIPFSMVETLPNDNKIV